MKLRRFNFSREKFKRNLVQNESKYIKRLTTSLSVFVIIIGIIYFSFARYESTEEFHFINTTVWIATTLLTMLLGFRQLSDLQIKENFIRKTNKVF